MSSNLIAQLKTTSIPCNENPAVEFFIEPALNQIVLEMLEKTRMLSIIVSFL